MYIYFIIVFQQHTVFPIGLYLLDKDYSNINEEIKYLYFSISFTFSDTLTQTYNLLKGDYYIIPATYFRKIKGSYYIYLYAEEENSFKLSQVQNNFTSQEIEQINSISTKQDEFLIKIRGLNLEKIVFI